MHWARDWKREKRFFSLDRVSYSPPPLSPLTRSAPLFQSPFLLASGTHVQRHGYRHCLQMCRRSRGSGYFRSFSPFLTIFWIAFSVSFSRGTEGAIFRRAFTLSFARLTGSADPFLTHSSYVPYSKTVGSHTSLRCTSGCLLGRYVPPLPNSCTRSLAIVSSFVSI